MTEPTLYTAPEFARQLGVSRQFVARACTSGLIKAERQGKIWLIPRSELAKQRTLRIRRERAKRRAAS